MKPLRGTPADRMRTVADFKKEVECFNKFFSEETFIGRRIAGKKSKNGGLVFLEHQKPFDRDNALHIASPINHNGVRLALLLQGQKSFFD